MTDPDDTRPLIPMEQAEGLSGQLTPGQSSSSRATVLLRFLAFAFAFSLAEAAVVASISVATSLFPFYGSLSVGALYLTFASSTVLAGAAVRSAGGELRPLLLTSMTAMGLYNAACLALVAVAGDVSEDPLTGRKDVPVSKSGGAFLVAIGAVSGVAEGIMWPAVGAYLTMTAQVMSIHEDGADAENKKDGGEGGGVDGRNKYGSSTSDAVATDESGKGIRETAMASLRRRLESALPRDFHVLAGSVTGIFNVVFLVSLLLGHLYTAYAFRAESYAGVSGAYTWLAAFTAAGIVIMFLAIAPPETDGREYDEMHYTEPEGCIECPHTREAPAARRRKPHAIPWRSNPVALAVGLTATEPACTTSPPPTPRTASWTGSCSGSWRGISSRLRRRWDCSRPSSP